MNRVLILLAFFGIFVVVFVGCGDQTEETKSTTPPFNEIEVDKTPENSNVRVLVEFNGYMNPSTGEFKLWADGEEEPARGDSGVSVVRQRITSWNRYDPDEEQDSVERQGSEGTIEIYSNGYYGFPIYEYDEACGPNPLYSIMGAFCGVITLTWFGTDILTDVYAELDLLDPPVGHAALDDALSPGMEGGPQSSLGLFFYGDMYPYVPVETSDLPAPGIDSTVRWIFEDYTDEDLWFHGRVLAILSEKCGDGVDNNLDGHIDEDCFYCPNGILEPQGGEGCDDGNAIAGDGCEPDCTVPDCGNDDLDEGEECDDGNLLPNDGCSPGCKWETCRNNILEDGEECDDGNAVDGDGCSVFCVIDFCGNSVIDNGEQCDDGNRLDFDGCDRHCQIELCSNGFFNEDEACDDGNREYGDGCSASCRLEEEVGEDCLELCLLASDCRWYGSGGPFGNSEEECLDRCEVEKQHMNEDDFEDYRYCVYDSIEEPMQFGGMIGGPPVSLICYDHTVFRCLCGDQRVQWYEECDDGNQDDGDGCSRYCLIELEECASVCEIMDECEMLGDGPFGDSYEECYSDCNQNTRNSEYLNELIECMEPLVGEEECNQWGIYQCTEELCPAKEGFEIELDRENLDASREDGFINRWNWFDNTESWDCAENPSGPDDLYEVTIDFTAANIMAGMYTDQFSPSLHVRKDQCNARSELDCDYGWPDDFIEVNTGCVEPGTYYFYADSNYDEYDNYATPHGEYLFTIAATPLSSHSLTLNEESPIGEILGNVGGESYFESMECGGEGPEEVIEVNLEFPVVTLKSGVVTDDWDVVEYAKTNPCDFRNEMSCYNERQPSAQISTGCVDPGTYYFFVDAQNQGDRGDYLFTVTAIPKPAYEAIPLSYDEPLNLDGDNENSEDMFYGKCGDFGGAEEVYKVTLDHDSKHLRGSTWGSEYDTVLYVKDDLCSNDMLDCNDDWNGWGPLSQVHARGCWPAGSSYYFFVDAFDSYEAGYYSFTVQSTPVMQDDKSFVMSDPEDIFIYENSDYIEGFSSFTGYCEGDIVGKYGPEDVFEVTFDFDSINVLAKIVDNESPTSLYGRTSLCDPSSQTGCGEPMDDWEPSLNMGCTPAGTYYFYVDGNYGELGEYMFTVMATPLEEGSCQACWEYDHEVVLNKDNQSHDLWSSTSDPGSGIHWSDCAEADPEIPEQVIKVILEEGMINVNVTTLGSSFDTNLYARMSICEEGDEEWCEIRDEEYPFPDIFIRFMEPGTYFFFVDGLEPSEYGDYHFSIGGTCVDMVDEPRFPE